MSEPRPAPSVFLREEPCSTPAPCAGPSCRRKSSPAKPLFSLFVYALFVILSLLAGVSAARAASENLPPEPADSLHNAFQDAVTLEQYGRAGDLLDSLRARQGAASPWTGLLEASLRLQRRADLGDTSGFAAFPQDVARLETRFLRALEAIPETDSTAQRRAALHAALGALGGMEAQRLADIARTPLKAAGPAGRSAEHFERACQLDPGRRDACVGVALHAFWRSHLLRFLTWTPFVADRREEALDTLQRVVRGSGSGRMPAAVGLAWVLIEAERPLDAAALADSLLATRGEVRGLLEPCGKAYFLAQRWDEARDRYERLVASLRAQPLRNVVREIGALNRLASIARARNDWAAVRQYADQALDLPLNERQRERKEDDLQRLRRLREEARERLDRQ